MFVLFILAVSAQSVTAGVTADRRPLIGLDFYSRSAPIDTSRVRMLVDGIDVTAGAMIDAWRISCRPPAPLEPGEHTAKVLVFDMDGNSAIKEWSFTVDPSASDTGAPVIEFAGPTPPNGAVLAGGAAAHTSVAALITDAASGVDPGSVVFSVTRGGAVFAAGATQEEDDGRYVLNAADFPDGRYVVSISASDMNGNAAKTVSTAFTIDGSAPRVGGLAAAPEELDPDGTLKLSFSAEDVPAANIDYCETEITGNEETYTRVLRPVADGLNVIRVRAEELGGRSGIFSAAVTCVDNAGNTASAEKAAGFRIAAPGELLSEIEAPGQRDSESFALEALPSCVNEASIDVRGRAPAGEDIALLVNGAERRRDTALAGDVFSFSSVDLENGYNDIAAAVVEPGGFPGARTAEQTVILDVIAPDIVPRFPGRDETIGGGEHTFEFDYSDNGECGVDADTIEMEIDGGLVGCALTAGDTRAACSLYEAPGAGNHSIRVEVADHAGNTVEESWTFDVSAPAGDEPGGGETPAGGGDDAGPGGGGDEPDGGNGDNDDTGGGDDHDNGQHGDDGGGNDGPGGDPDDGDADEPGAGPGDEPGLDDLEIDLHVKLDIPGGLDSLKDISLLIGGEAPAGASVILYINGRRFTEVVADAGDTFTFDFDSIKDIDIPFGAVVFQVEVEYYGEVFESDPVEIDIADRR